MKAEPVCRWHRDATVPGGRFFVPGCWGGLQNMDFSNCYCDRRKHRASLEDRIEKLEAMVRNLTGPAKGGVG
jgi:hypothetical protein